MKVFLSLPVSGFDEQERWQYAARTSAMLAIRHDGWEVVNPFHIASRLVKQKIDDTGFIVSPTHDEYMRANIEALSQCDLVLFCPGWHLSEECKEEMTESRMRGIDVALLDEDGIVFGF